MDRLIYHIATATDWAARTDAYVPERFDTEGFIHCSTSSQIADVASRLFRGRDDLVVLLIDPDRVFPFIRYENLEGGHELYPHIYGPLNAGAILDSRPMCVDQGGNIVSELPVSPTDTNR